MSDVVRRMAEAVIKPGTDVGLIPEDNRKVDRWLTLAEAIGERRAFAAWLREGVIVFDVDEPAHLLWAETARLALSSLGCAVVRVGSGQADHEHWWFVGPVGWTSEQLRAVALENGAPAKQVRRTDMRCRPPLSPHRLGGRGDLIEPVDAEEALWRLTGRPNAVTFDPAWVGVLNGHDPKGRYVTASGSFNRGSAALGAALAYINAGLDWERFSKDVHASTAVGAKAAQERPKWLESTWLTALARVKSHPPMARTDEQLRLLALTAHEYPWKGRPGETDRRVYSVLVKRAHHVGNAYVAIDQRSIAVEAGATRPTVSASLARLRTAGLVSVDVPGDRRQATRYRLHAKSRATFTNNDLWSPSEACIGLVGNDFASPPDAFRGRNALPVGAYATWLAMPVGEWITVNEVVLRRPGELSPDTVRRHLREPLLSSGLVDRRSPRGHHWMRLEPSPAQLDRLASRLGSSGATALQADRYEAERLAADEQFYAITGQTRVLPKAS